MTDREVIESFNNAWRALCKQYKEYPRADIQSALNMLGRIIGEVESEVEKSHREGQITLEEWIEMLNERLED